MKGFIREIPLEYNGKDISVKIQQHPESDAEHELGAAVWDSSLVLINSFCFWNGWKDLFSRNKKGFFFFWLIFALF